MLKLLVELSSYKTKKTHTKKKKTILFTQGEKLLINEKKIHY